MLKATQQCIVAFTTFFCLHSLAMNKQFFNLTQACYNESQNILQSHNKDMIIYELKKIKTSSYSIQSLADIRIPKGIYNLTHTYLISYNIPVCRVTFEETTPSFNEITISAYNVITEQATLFQSVWYGSLKKVALEILQFIEIDSLGSQLQTTHFDDVMDLEK